MKIFGWDVDLSLSRHRWHTGFVCCIVDHQYDGKSVSFVLCVPWLFYARATMWKDRDHHVSVIVVDVDLAVEVPASLGDKAPDAVLNAMVKMVELRRWRCAGGVSAHLSEDDDDEWSS